MRFYTLLFLSLALTFAACEKDSTTEVVTFTQSTLSGETVTANFFGQLTNDQDEVVANAEVRIGNKQTTTDQEGLWSIDNTTVVKDQAFIQFAAERHHKGSRTLLVEERRTYEVDVEMLQFTGTNTVDASAGGTVTVAGSDASVSFPSGAFAKTDGTPYTGTVRVEAAYLDPNELSTANRMPGDLRATTAEGNSRLLITYGMLSVELFDDLGNELQIADGQTATISLPVTGEAANTAPASIPLWFFDESSAQWIEEGTATLQNGAYVGEVSHFTFWNCDIPTDYVRLCGTVVFEGVDSTTAANLRLIIESTIWGNGYGYTDENGQFCGIVPANETLNFLVQGDCNEPIYSVTIGPFSADTDLGTIIIPRSVNFLSTVSGTASCNGVPLTSGAVRIYQSGRQITATIVQSDGSFNTNFLSCDTANITVRVINYATLEESDDVVFAFSNNIATGDIEACSVALTSFFELIVNNGTPQLGDSILFGRDNGFAFMNGDGFTATESFGFNLFVDEGIIPVPAVVGTYTILGNSQSGLSVSSNNLPAGTIRVSSDFDLSITSVATQQSPFTVGQIGPFVETITDSMGVVSDYTIQINFSAPTI
jgi:hypothetical protein